MRRLKKTKSASPTARPQTIFATAIHISREYSSGSLDPKIEVYYRSEVDPSSDSTIIDTLTRLVYVSEDLSLSLIHI